MYLRRSRRRINVRVVATVGERGSSGLNLEKQNPALSSASQPASEGELDPLVKDLLTLEAWWSALISVILSVTWTQDLDWPTYLSLMLLLNCKFKCTIAL
ncbi:hypothetical protein Syun_023911 [Stephania yunnanensis]|uniref:Uncharacterized protein n=1 Tax=Stephania yunnanensis TaxID=152371 RepID=A0AAP0FDM5_9MAGN